MKIKTLAILITGLILTATTATAESPAVASRERPAKPIEITRYASPVSAAGIVDGKPEGVAFLSTLSPELQAKLKTDKKVLLGEPDSSKGSYGGLIKAVVLFNQSKPRVFELITQPSRQVTYLPRLTKSDTIWRSPFGELMDFNVKVLFVSMSFQTQHWYFPEYSRVEWLLNPEFDNDIAQQIGFWQLYAAGDNYTVAEYGTLVDTGIAIPQRIQESLARRDIPKALDHFQIYINSDGTWTRDD
jgi:hypothetical protein